MSHEVEVRLATEEDDDLLRCLLRENPMKGAITVTMEREPCYFSAAATEGDIHRTVLAVEKESGKPIGMGTWNSYLAWLGGHRRRIGYLGQFRVAEGYRGRPALYRRGFRMVFDAVQSFDVACHFTTIVEDNVAARRFLERPKKGFPRYWPVGKVCALCIPVSDKRTSETRREMTARSCTEDDYDQLVTFMERIHSNHELAPAWTKEDLLNEKRTRGLSGSDFLIVERQGEIVACAALWDQVSFKQAVVHSYTWPLNVLRHMPGFILRVLGAPQWPAPGSPLRHAYLSMFACMPHVPDAALCLIDEARRVALSKGLAYITVGLSENHPLLASLRTAYRNIEYRGCIYGVTWKDHETMDWEEHRIPHVEIAFL